ncbi:MAG TPA: hypothetical protein EYG86_07980 [Crocinitomicaceae bacterium]|nr:hypothetical protein [Crocinitomicaceae bacterium]
MLEGALIGLIVAVVVMLFKKNKQKKALAEINNSDTLDTPSYSAFFHHSPESIFKGKGFKFFDTNGVGYISGNNFNYKTKKDTLTFDLATCGVEYAGKKKKLDWVSIEDNGVKHYFTSFQQGAFKLNDSEMDNFIEKLQQLKPEANLEIV